MFFEKIIFLWKLLCLIIFIHYWECTFFLFLKIKVVCKCNLDGHQCTNSIFQGVFRKKKSKDYLKINIKKGFLNVGYVWISGITLTWNASTWSSRWIHWYEQHFWTAWEFCDLGEQADLHTKKNILPTPRCWQFWYYDMDSRSPPSSLICAI